MHTFTDKKQAGLSDDGAKGDCQKTLLDKEENDNELRIIDPNGKRKGKEEELDKIYSA